MIYKTDVFLTHDWGEDELGRSNHERVSKVNKYLQSRGIHTWFDEERMNGNIRDKMADGIEHTRLVLAFITEKYRNKVNSNNAADNCYFEFNYATLERTGNYMIPIVMEPKMKNSRDWKGRLGAELGSHLYIDLTSDDLTIFTKKCEDLYEIVKTLLDNFNKAYIASGGGGEEMETVSVKSDLPTRIEGESSPRPPPLNNRVPAALHLTTSSNPSTSRELHPPVNSSAVVPTDISPRQSLAVNNILSSTFPSASPASQQHFFASPNKLLTVSHPISHTTTTNNSNQSMKLTFSSNGLSSLSSTLPSTTPSPSLHSTISSNPNVSITNNLINSLNNASVTPNQLPRPGLPVPSNQATPVTTTTDNTMKPKFSFAGAFAESLNSQNNKSLPFSRPSLTNSNHHQYDTLIMKKKECPWCKGKNEWNVKKCVICNNSLENKDLPSDLLQESLLFSNPLSFSSTSSASSAASSSHPSLTALQNASLNHPVHYNINVNRIPISSQASPSAVIPSSSTTTVVQRSPRLSLQTGVNVLNQI
jgi:hypothetical protein